MTGPATALAAGLLLASAPGPVPLWLRVLAGVAAAALALPGVWMLWGGRDFSATPLDDLEEPRPPARTTLHALRASLSRPSRTAVGLGLLILAWHAVAWTQPRLGMLQVPLERWWILALGVLIAVWASLAMDRSFNERE